MCAIITITIIITIVIVIIIITFTHNPVFLLANRPSHLLDRIPEIASNVYFLFAHADGRERHQRVCVVPVSYNTPSLPTHRRVQCFVPEFCAESSVCGVGRDGADDVGRVDVLDSHVHMYALEVLGDGLFEEEADVAEGDVAALVAHLGVVLGENIHASAFSDDEDTVVALEETETDGVHQIVQLEFFFGDEAEDGGKKRKRKKVSKKIERKEERKDEEKEKRWMYIDRDI